jgi:hypothetical protein
MLADARIMVIVPSHRPAHARGFYGETFGRLADR